MFVKNKEKIDFEYRKGTYLAVLKAMTVSYVDESKVSAKELLACYGQRIDIISRDLAMQIAPGVKEDKKEVKKAKVVKPVETVKKEDLNDAFIEKVLGEIEGNSKMENPNLTVTMGDTSDTGNKEVDNFLNGKTDKLPEGTVEITKDEANKLEEKVNAPKVNAPKVNESKVSKVRTGRTSTKGRARTGRTKAKKN